MLCGRQPTRTNGVFFCSRNEVSQALVHHTAFASTATPPVALRVALLCSRFWVSSTLPNQRDFVTRGGTCREPPLYVLIVTYIREHELNCSHRRTNAKFVSIAVETKNLYHPVLQKSEHGAKRRAVAPRIVNNIESIAQHMKTKHGKRRDTAEKHPIWRLQKSA